MQVFDSWAGELSPHDFAAFSLPSLVHISTSVRARLAEIGLPVPLTLFARGANQSISVLAAQSGYDVLGLDWCIEPTDARRIIDEARKGGHKTIAVQGNVDPIVLFGGRHAIEAEVKHMCEGFGKQGGWIANLGHGISPGVNPDDLKWFFECVHKYSSV